ncbi:MAG: four helix bundle protein [bacterium]|nr:four helix bundle protein [bacterium]
MQQVASTIKSFTSLKAWQESHRLVLNIYKTTKQFPSEELFGLTSQIRRAAVSITSNIAEGFNRRSPKDKIRFYDMAQASAAELQNQLLIARDVGYISDADFLSLANNSVTAHKIIGGLIRSIK